MLTVSRKPDERVTITVPPSNEPTVIEVVQCEIRRHQSRIAFKAPQAVRIMRNELIDQETKP